MHGPPIIITTADNAWRSIAKCMVIIRYLNDNAQTPLNRFTVYMLYSHLCNKYSENHTDGAYALVYRTYVVDRQRWETCRRSYWSQLAACDGEIFSKSTVVQTKISHVSKTTPFLFVILLARLNIVSLYKKIESLASVIPEIWMGHPKFENVSRVVTMPLSGTFGVHRLGIATINL